MRGNAVPIVNGPLSSQKCTILQDFAYKTSRLFRTGGGELRPSRTHSAGRGGASSPRCLDPDTNFPMVRLRQRSHCSWFYETTIVQNTHRLSSIRPPRLRGQGQDQTNTRNYGYTHSGLACFRSQVRQTH